MESGFLLKKLSEIPFVSTSHGVGLKQVLLSNEETESSITQIARASLKAGESVEEHCHQTMDEHFLSLEGSGYIYVGGNRVTFSSGTYILIKAGSKHRVEAISNLSFMTIGVAL